MTLKEEEPGLWRPQKLASYYLAMLPPECYLLSLNAFFSSVKKKAYLTGFQRIILGLKYYNFFFHTPLICIISDFIDLHKKGFDSIFKRTGFVVKA